MDWIMNRIFGRGRMMIVRTDSGLVMGKAYCREREVGGYISEMMKLTKGNVKVSIERC